jgi:septal ring factor EnvC (AmiA/AmiB activator)
MARFAHASPPRVASWRHLYRLDAEQTLLFPFHEHEFEYTEFGAALREVFPSVKILLQDRLEAFGFYEPRQVHEAHAEIARATDNADAANFFVAVCSTEPLPDLDPFLYVPSAANLLRERETHIHKLELELDDVRRWLEETTRARNHLLARQAELENDSRDKTNWAREMEVLLNEARTRVAEMTAAHTAAQVEAQRVVDGLNEELQQSTAWALATNAELQASREELKASVELLQATREASREELLQTTRLLDRAEATVIERTEWAQRANAEAETLKAQLAQIRESRWVKLGRAFGVGPKIDG